jgi:hypothetical protein
MAPGPHGPDLLLRPVPPRPNDGHDPLTRVMLQAHHVAQFVHGNKHVFSGSIWGTLLFPNWGRLGAIFFYISGPDWYLEGRRFGVVPLLTLDPLTQLTG